MTDQVDIFGGLTPSERVAAIRAVKDANPERPHEAVQDAKRQARLFEPQMEGQLALGGDDGDA